MEKDLAKEILTLLNNNHTKVKEVSDINGNYYNYIADTIYMTTNMDNIKKERLDETNLFCAKLVTICHECIHSIQSKVLHILNILLSNLSIIISVVAIILMISFNKPTWYIVFGVAIVFLSTMIRLVLEIDAIYGSLNLAEKVVNNLKIEIVKDSDISEARRVIRRLLPIQIIKMILDKIIMLAILVI